MRVERVEGHRLVAEVGAEPLQHVRVRAVADRGVGDAGCPVVPTQNEERERRLRTGGLLELLTQPEVGRDLVEKMMITDSTRQNLGRALDAFNHSWQA